MDKTKFTILEIAPALGNMEGNDSQIQFANY
jgi:hypothetical protein